MNLMSFVYELKIYTKPNILKAWLFGLASGLALMLTGNTLNFWIASKGIDKTIVGFFTLVSFPYIFKFLWAPIIDLVKIPILHEILGQKKSWIIISQIFLIIFIICLSLVDIETQLPYLAIFGFLVAFAAVSQDIALDAYRVNILNSENRAAVAAIYIFGYRIGMLISGGGAIYLSSYISWQEIYSLMALIVFFISLVILFTCYDSKNIIMDEQKKSKFYKIDKWFIFLFIEPFTKNMKFSNFILIILFVIIYKLPDNIVIVMLNSFYIYLKYSTTEIATASKIIGLISAIVGGMISGFIIPKLNIYRSLFIFGIIHFSTHLLLILQNNMGYNIFMLYFVIILEQVTGGMAMTAYIMLITELSHGKHAGTKYALLSSMMGLSRVIIPSFSGWLVTEVGWNYFFLCAILCGLPSLILIKFIKNEK